MKIVVYLRGEMLKPNILLFCAQGMARRVRRLPAAPMMAMTIQLELEYHRDQAMVSFHITYMVPVVIVAELLYG